MNAQAHKLPSAAELAEREEIAAYPQWFRGAVVGGVQELILLKLVSAPPLDDEVIFATAREWLAVIWHVRHWDAPDVDAEVRQADRIREAFLRLKAWINRWPAPRDFLNQLDRLERPRREFKIVTDGKGREIARPLPRKAAPQQPAPDAPHDAKCAVLQ